MRALQMIAWAMLVLMSAGGPAAAIDELPKDRLEVMTQRGSGLLPLFLSSGWDKPQPHVARVIVVFHGAGRNGNGYFESANGAASLTGEAGRTFIVAPQFLISKDLEIASPPQDHDRLLRWRSNGRWTDGRDAEAPAPLSSFDAIDAILARLADRTTFPNLKQVVLAGHSAGGQMVQRYAIVGQGTSKLADVGVPVRYVVANPSSYAYLTADRPRSAGECDESYNDWKYGLDDLPRYVPRMPVDALKRAYLERDVVYLLGTNDDNLDDKDLDRRCQANAQGHSRLARGASYFAYLQKEHPGFRHRLQLVYGVDHSARAMFTSNCGVAVLFDVAGCGQ
jgi:pimeloyl-ACP methyl ester carboxylesterase